jgi:hypothetical protein
MTVWQAYSLTAWQHDSTRHWQFGPCSTAEHASQWQPSSLALLAASSSTVTARQRDRQPAQRSGSTQQFKAILLFLYCSAIRHLESEEGCSRRRSWDDAGDANLNCPPRRPGNGLRPVTRTTPTGGRRGPRTTPAGDPAAAHRPPPADGGGSAPARRPRAGRSTLAVEKGSNLAPIRKGGRLALGLASRDSDRQQGSDDPSPVQGKDLREFEEEAGGWGGVDKGSTTASFI